MKERRVQVKSGGPWVNSQVKEEFPGTMGPELKEESPSEGGEEVPCLALSLPTGKGLRGALDARLMAGTGHLAVGGEL